MGILEPSFNRDLSMVLTTSFSPPCPSLIGFEGRKQGRSRRLRRGPGPREAPGRAGGSRPHILSAPRAGLVRRCWGSLDPAPVSNPGARRGGGGGVGARRRHVPAAVAAGEGSISSARSRRSAPPQTAPPAAPSGRAARRLRG